MIKKKQTREKRQIASDEQRLHCTIYNFSKRTSSNSWIVRTHKALFRRSTNNRPLTRKRAHRFGRSAIVRVATRTLRNDQLPKEKFKIYYAAQMLTKSVKTINDKYSKLELEFEDITFEPNYNKLQHELIRIFTKLLSKKNISAQQLTFLSNLAE